MQQVFGMEDLKNSQIEGKRVLVRVDFNVPMQDGKVTDTTRLKACLPTIEFLLKKNCKVILMSHFGRPKGKKDLKYSLKPVALELGSLIRKEVKFASDCIGPEAESVVNSLDEAEICLLENVRFYSEEETNEEGFSKKLASLGELYVNDAFGSAHRAHASTTGVAKFLKPSVAGFLMEKEITELGNLLQRPERPFTSIIGGSKVSSKIDILDSLIEKSDVVLVGGGMAYTFIKARGGKIGKSICEDDKLSLASELIQKAKDKGTAFILPDDNLCIKDFNNKSEVPQPVLAGQIDDELEGCDVGPITCENFSRYISESKTILWNGPVGIFEDDRFASGSKAIAEALTKVQANGGKTVIGGGDSAAAVAKFGFTDKDFGHISTGGGASLEFLEGKTLPGVAALDKI
ncbi:MAG: phosphoglycerate kinase [Candidatus Caenarcaniphilales bacterium]|nr:phosphoglycerate kinase [Candidatus Caenarcaniphilales bacterium]